MNDSPTAPHNLIDARHAPSGLFSLVRRLAHLGGALLLSACASLPNTQQRWQTAQDVAATQRWQAQTLHTAFFDVAAWTPAHFNGSASGNQTLTVYVEGDGLAWLSRTEPSNDPTPMAPTALQLAMAQPSGPAAYLARPCQYVKAANDHCRSAFWTHKRFAPQVIDAMNDAVDRLKSQAGAQRLVLVGYSGGAAVTALLAERRIDVVGWLTVAGNVDHRAWAAHQRVSPLVGSLDPMADKAALMGVPQWHFVGDADRIIPLPLVRDFARQMPLAKVIVMPNYDHTCCWVRQWPQLWRDIYPAPPANTGAMP